MNASIARKKTSRGSHVLYATLAFAALVFLAWLRFHPWFPIFFSGDDLFYINNARAGTCATLPSEWLTAVCQDRFRPVPVAYVLTLMWHAGAQPALYMASNILIVSLSAFLVFLSGLQLSKNNIAASLAVALLAASSKFALFHATQLIGPTEGLTLLFCIAAFYACLRADSSNHRAFSWGIAAVVAAFLAGHTHERSLVVSGWIFLFFALSANIRSLSKVRFFTLLAAAAFVPLFYVGYKRLVLATDFMVGTGGTRIELDTQLVVQHALEASLSIFGFNRGPEYLMGMQVEPGWNVSFVLAMAFAVLWFGMIVMGVWLSTKNKPLFGQLRIPLMIALLAALCLGPALLTIRLELRWLMLPFTLLMLLPLCTVGLAKGKVRLAAATMVVALSVIGFFIDSLIFRHFNNLNFIRSAIVATGVKQKIIDTPEFYLTKNILIEGNIFDCKWVLDYGSFFKVYGNKDITIECVDGIDNEAIPSYPEETRVLSIDKHGHVSRKDRRNEKLIFDFVSSFSDDLIANDSPADTPTGKGVLVLERSTVQGSSKALIILSGYEVVFRNIHIEAPATLLLGAGSVFERPNGFYPLFNYRIEAQDSSADSISSRISLPAPKDGETMVPQPLVVDLTRFSGKTVDIYFSTESPTEDKSGHWAGIIEPRIIFNK